MSDDEVRKQLVLAYLQMEKCQQVLRGENVEPVAMKDNGMSSDLELFYLCKKVREELAHLNQIAHKGTDKGDLVVSYDKRAETFLSDNLDDITRFTMNLSYMKKIVCDNKKVDTPQVGSVVYFLKNGKIHKSVLTEYIGLELFTDIPVCKVKGCDNGFRVVDIYSTPEELAQNVGKKVQNHYSFSKDHESAYFIDSTNRVFRGAKWYLGERRITFYETVDGLRENLLHEANIIDDTRKRPEL